MDFLFAPGDLGEEIRGLVQKKREGEKIRIRNDPEWGKGFSQIGKKPDEM